MRLALAIGDQVLMSVPSHQVSHIAVGLPIHRLKSGGEGNLPVGEPDTGVIPGRRTLSGICGHGSLLHQAMAV